MPPLPQDFPLPFGSASPAPAGAAPALPPAWVYRVMAAALPPAASVEVEAVQAVACAAGEFIAFLSHAAREEAGPAGAVGAGQVLGALDALGYEQYAPLLERWLRRAEAANTRAVLAATAAAGERAASAGGGGGGGGGGGEAMADG